jgi:hypothetical protein
MFSSTRQVERRCREAGRPVGRDELSLLAKLGHVPSIKRCGRALLWSEAAVAEALEALDRARQPA